MKLSLITLVLVGFLVSCGGGGGGGKDGVSDLDGEGLSGDAKLETVDGQDQKDVLKDLLPEDTLPDTLPDTLKPDTEVKPDTKPDLEPKLGEVGDSCIMDSDCVSSICLWAGDGKKCSIACNAQVSCPFEWHCGSLPGDSATLCIPTGFNLCKPCSENTDCNSNGVDVGDRCVAMGGVGNFCGQACSSTKLCPLDYSCHGVLDVKSYPSDQCIKVNAACDCSKTATNEGAWTKCFRQNLFGICNGERFCGPNGLTECSATEPTEEVCDGVDNNCNGEVDEGAKDLDGDTIPDCQDDDMDGDEVPNIQDNCIKVKNPGQENLDGDAMGDACDNDKDGDGDPDASDCAPLDNTRYHGNQELCDGVDNDCVGGVPANEADADGDGFRGCANDCNDNNPKVHPGAPELCETTYDDDCDGSPNTPQPADCTQYYKDNDKDGFGRPDEAACLCAPDANHTSTKGTDCNDDNPEINPLAIEDCKDNADTNCSGNDLNALNCTVFYLDKDKDGYGTNDSVCGCQAFDFYTATNPNDCLDNNADVNPTKTEDCTTVYDDNCNGTDNDVNAKNCVPLYQDKDGDNFGVGAAICLCHKENLIGAPNDKDCDDTNGLIYPGAREDCQTPYDDNCNTKTNEIDGIGCTKFWTDADGDGYAGTETCLCEKPAGASDKLEDCCDQDDRAHPNQTLFFTTERKICGGYDYNCDGMSEKQYPGVCVGTGSCNGTGWFQLVQQRVPNCSESSVLCSQCTSCGSCGGGLSQVTQGCR